MKNLNVIYDHGNLYDKNTKKRIHLKNNAEIVIVGNERDFLIEDPLERDITILSSKEKEAKLLLISGLTEYKKLLEKGNYLFFDIKLSPKNHKRKIQSQFKVELLEDLYAYKKSNWKRKKTLLFNCSCKLVDNPSKDIKYFEELKGISLNNIYEITFVTYFAKQGSPSVNAFERFYTDQSNENSTIEKLRYRNYKKANKK